MKNVAWIVSGKKFELTSSYRYNAVIPARELSSRILRFDPDDDTDQFLSSNQMDAIIICKALHKQPGSTESHNFIELATKSQKKGIKVCFHICDWHFENPVYKTLAEISDLVVVQTKFIAMAVEKHFGKTPVVIEEPYEGPRGKILFKPRKTLKLVWFGHSQNLDTLAEGIRQLSNLNHLFKLTIVTNDVDLGIKCFDSVPKPNYLIERKVISFSLEAQWREIESSDIVLIPSINTKEKQVKGHNRLVQSIHSGRLAIAFPLPQYEELGEYCLCYEDMAEGISWALQNRKTVFKRLKAGQKYIDQRFAPSVVAMRWKEELTRMLHESR